MKHIYVNLKRFDISPERGGVNRLAPMAEKRRQAARAGGNPSQVAAVEAAEYPDLLRQVYRRADIQKPRNLIGLAKDISVDQMEALLTASIAVPADAMNALAVARAVAVRDHLAGRGAPLDRLFLGAVKLGAPAGDGGAVRRRCRQFGNP